MQDTRSLNDQHPVERPGLAGALDPLLKGGEGTRAGHRRVRRDAQKHGDVEGKKKCSGVKGRLRLVGPCRGLHCGDWRDRGDVV